MPSSEKVLSPGVFTNEIDQTFLPAAIGEIGAALLGPTVKGPAGIPTVVQSYSEFQQKFWDEEKTDLLESELQKDKQDRLSPYLLSRKLLDS